MRKPVSVVKILSPNVRSRQSVITGLILGIQKITNLDITGLNISLGIIYQR